MSTPHCCRTRAGAQQAVAQIWPLPPDVSGASGHRGSIEGRELCIYGFSQRGAPLWHSVWCVCCIQIEVDGHLWAPPPAGSGESLTVWLKSGYNSQIWLQTAPQVTRKALKLRRSLQQQKPGQGRRQVRWRCVALVAVASAEAPDGRTP